MVPREELFFDLTTRFSGEVGIRIRITGIRDKGGQRRSVLSQEMEETDHVWVDVVRIFLSAGEYPH